jgi:hypothetical protein
MYFKRMSKVLNFSLVSLATFFSCQFLSITSSNAQLTNQTGASTGQSTHTSNELLNGIIVAFVSGIIGFLVSFFIERLKKKSEPRKQISFSKVLKSGIIGNIEKDIENKIGIVYNGKPAQNMFYALFDIENTGNQQIKNQEIRFEFSDDSEILDTFFSPKKIEPEIELKELPQANLGKHEKKYSIGVIKPGEKLGFRFIVQGSKDKSLDFNYHTKNDEDVGFIKVEDRKSLDDIEQVKFFLVNCLIASVLFPLLKEILPFVEPLFSVGSLAVFGLLILPRLEEFIKSIVSLVSTAFKEKSDMQSQRIEIMGSGHSINIDNFPTSSSQNKGQGN